MQSPHAWQSGRDRLPARIAGTAGQLVFLTHTLHIVHASLFKPELRKRDVLEDPRVETDGTGEVAKRPENEERQDRRHHERRRPDGDERPVKTFEGVEVVVDRLSRGENDDEEHRENQRPDRVRHAEGERDLELLPSGIP